MIRLFIIFTILTYCTVHYANAQTKNNKNIQLKYGIYLKKIVPNVKEGKFYAEFYWWVSFVNDSLKTGFSNEDILNLQYVNGCEIPKDAFQNEIQEYRTISEHKYYYTGYHQGNFFFNPDFRNYPFDKQKLNIEIEHFLLQKNQLDIVSDTASYQYSKMPKDFFGIGADLMKNSNISLKIYKSEILDGVCTYNCNFGDPDFLPESKFSRHTFSVLMRRTVEPYITKVFIPLGIILFLVYFVFFIPANKLDMAAGLTVTSLLSAIAFQFTINSDLPEIGYMIYVDKIFYLTYVLIVLAMGESLLTFYLDLSEDPKKKKMALKIDFYSRILFPLIFIVFSIVFKEFG